MPSCYQLASVSGWVGGVTWGGRDAADPQPLRMLPASAGSAACAGSSSSSPTAAAAPSSSSSPPASRQQQQQAELPSGSGGGSAGPLNSPWSPGGAASRALLRRPLLRARQPAALMLMQGAHVLLAAPTYHFSTSACKPGCALHPPICLPASPDPLSSAAACHMGGQNSVQVGRGSM